MEDRIYEIRAIWDSEARVWVVTSDDVPGLVTEAETIDGVLKNLAELLPYLLEANGIIASGDLPDIPIHLMSERSELLSRQ